MMTKHELAARTFISDVNLQDYDVCERNEVRV